MTDQTIVDAIADDIPLHTINDETRLQVNDNPPTYHNVQLVRNGEWKDIGYAIAFCIYVVIIVLLAYILGIPAAHDEKIELIGFTRKPTFGMLFSFKITIIVTVSTCFLTLFIFLLCARHLIKYSFLLFIIILLLFEVILYDAYPPLGIIPAAFLIILLIYIRYAWKRIRFVEAHLETGSCVLRTHPSLILVAIIMIVVELLWYIFWGLMLVGVIEVLSPSTSSIKSNTDINKIYTKSLSTFSGKPLSLLTTASTSNQNVIIIHDPLSWAQETATIKTTTSTKEESNVGWTNTIIAAVIIIYLLLLPLWYWAAITFGNIVHFIVACTVADWWFANTDHRQYGIGNSIKRALTKNFGTICYGSLFEPIIKLLGCFMKNERHFIARIIVKVMGYKNEWAFTFAALTGQGFAQASKTSTELFKKHGWTAVANDSIIGISLVMINISIGCIVEVFDPVFFGFLIGIFVSSIITTLIVSCVRTVFVCFALNPIVLSAAHHDQLKKLVKAWHKFYPQEFANSGYDRQFEELIN